LWLGPDLTQIGSPSHEPHLDVNTLCLYVLVLLAVLLPIREAVAAAMPCLGESTPTRQLDAGAVQHHRMGRPTSANTNADAAAHSAVHSHHDHGGAGHTGKCKLCTACCCGPALPSTGRLTLESLAPVLTRFPAPTTPDASYWSGGQERAARSI
jgi:hypothetical protein